jgi:hypothetical protein
VIALLDRESFPRTPKPKPKPPHPAPFRAPIRENTHTTQPQRSKEGKEETKESEKKSERKSIYREVFVCNSIPYPFPYCAIHEGRAKKTVAVKVIGIGSNPPHPRLRSASSLLERAKSVESKRK